MGEAQELPRTYCGGGKGGGSRGGEEVAGKGRGHWGERPRPDGGRLEAAEVWWEAAICHRLGQVWTSGPSVTPCAAQQARRGASSTSDKTKRSSTQSSTRCTRQSRSYSDTRALTSLIECPNNFWIDEFRALGTFDDRGESDRRYAIFSDPAASLDRVASDRLGLGQRLTMASIDFCSRLVSRGNSVTIRWTPGLTDLTQMGPQGA